MGFRGFLAVYLTIVIGAATLITVMAPRLQIRNEIISSNHFSVRWMGFSPTDYNNSYPEYTICINDLKDNPLKMQIAFQIKNQEAQGYYFLIDGYSAPAGWAFDPYQIGYINVDETKAFIYENVTRILPSAILQGRLTETIALVVKAYYNETYTNLYSEDNLEVVFNFIDRTSLAWTILYNDDFSDATTQNWLPVGDGVSQGANSISATASPDYYRSFQYSLKLVVSATGHEAWDPYLYPYHWVYPAWQNGGLHKEFAVPDVAEVYMVFSLRSNRFNLLAESGIMINGTSYFKADALPLADKWYQFTIPLPKNCTSAVDIWITHVYSSGNYADSATSYLDDVYVIAK